MNYYTHEDADRCKKYGDVVNGISFDWWLVNANGAGFCLLPTKGLHTEEQVKKAKAQLKANRDVVGSIKVCWLKECLPITQF